MNLDYMLKDVSVLGGAGKMGRGISALLAIEILNTKLRLGDDGYRLNIVDIDYDFLKSAVDYIETITEKWAEKNINTVRNLYKNNPNLVHNKEHIEQYVKDIRSIIRTGIDIETLAKDSRMVFEAIIEDENLKIEKLKEVRDIDPKNKTGYLEDVMYFTNTSSIPISVLDDGADLRGNIIGYHFYNPPPAQKLLELISNDKTNHDLITIANELAERLGKTVVESNDIAGFIGNGHFMRECIYATKLVEDLTKEGISEYEAIYRVNEITEKYLVRPMGIFQLMDYVGIDVVQKILKVMERYIYLPFHIDENFSSELINKFIDKEVKGGQNPDSSQKDGFLKYKKGKIVRVYDFKEEKYELFEKTKWYEKSSKEIKDEIPEGNLPWKKLFRDKKKDTKLDDYFNNLKLSNTKSAKIAKDYLIKSANIAEKLVIDRVANSIDDVTKVLMLGFAHIYDAIKYKSLIKGE